MVRVSVPLREREARARASAPAGAGVLLLAIFVALPAIAWGGSSWNARGPEGGGARGAIPVDWAEAASSAGATGGARVAILAGRSR